MRGLQIMSIGDIPVRVSLWYGLLIFFMLRGGNLQSGLLWVAVVTVSILVHELGHALVARKYRLGPQILLHGLGGLCMHDRAERDLHDVFIISAGPGAGLILGALTWVFSLIAHDWLVAGDYVWALEAIRASLFINIGWSLVNLLPIWPLDGGQLFRLGMLRLARPRLAERITHVTGLVVLIAALGLYGSGNTLLVVLVFWIGWANVSALMSNRASGPIRSVNRLAKDLLKQAEAAYAEDDFEAAARFCQQIRNEKNVSEAVLKRVWPILGVSSARNGNHEEALSFLQHAAATPAVTEAKIECFYALRRDAELDALLSSPAFMQLDETRRAEILEVVRPTTVS